MTREVITVTPETTIAETARLMLEHKIGGLPVMDQGALVGIITESDIFRVLVQEPQENPLDRIQEYQTSPYAQTLALDPDL